MQTAGCIKRQKAKGLPAVLKEYLRNFDSLLGAALLNFYPLISHVLSPRCHVFLAVVPHHKGFWILGFSGNKMNTV